MNINQAKEVLGLSGPGIIYRLKVLGHTWERGRLDITPELLEAVKGYKRKKRPSLVYGVDSTTLMRWREKAGIKAKDPRVALMVQLRKTGFYTWRGIREILKQQGHTLIVLIEPKDF